MTLPNDLMAEACAERGPILLNGEGGDPCLGGPKNVPMLLSRRRVRRQGLLRPEYVDALLAYDRDAVTGRHGLKIWMLMTLSLWHEQVFG